MVPLFGPWAERKGWRKIGVGWKPLLGFWFKGGVLNYLVWETGIKKVHWEIYWDLNLSLFQCFGLPEYIFSVLVHNVVCHYERHSLKQTTRLYLSCWRQSRAEDLGTLWYVGHGIPTFRMVQLYHYHCGTSLSSSPDRWTWHALCGMDTPTCTGPTPITGTVSAHISGYTVTLHMDIMSWNIKNTVSCPKTKVKY